MITYPVDVTNTQWAVFQISTAQVIARRQQWPRSDGGEIQGLDPDYVYLLHVDDAEPNYDSRLYQLVGTETIDVPSNELRLSWATQERPLEEQLQAVENREAEQLESVVQKLAREALETRLIVGAIIKYALNNQTFPPVVQNRMDDYEAKAVKVWDNRQVALAKIQAITDHAADPQTNPLPDLDADWTA